MNLQEKDVGRATGFAHNYSDVIVQGQQGPFSMSVDRALSKGLVRRGKNSNEPPLVIIKQGS